MRENRIIIPAILAAVILIAVLPLVLLRGAQFSGSDDAGSEMVEEINGDYEPWFTPVAETVFKGEIPGEVESLIFCIQTGIGTGIFAFFMGRFVERKKWTDRERCRDRRGSAVEEPDVFH